MTVLKNVKAALKTDEQTIYTCPASTSAIVLSGIFSNGREGAVSTTVGWKDSSDSNIKTPIIDSVSTNANTTLGILAGKLILEAGDSIYGNITSGDEFVSEKVAGLLGYSWYGIIVRGTRKIIFGSASNQASKIYVSDNNGAWTLKYTASDTSTSFENSTYLSQRGYNRFADNGTVIAAVRTGGKIITSADAGNTWVERSSGITTDFIFIKWIAHLNLFIAGGASGVIFKGSADGNVWTSVGPNTSGVSFAAAETNGTTVVCAGSNTTTPVIYTTTDGTTWTSRTVTAVASSVVNGVSWNGSKFLITFYNLTNIRLSTDGTTWTDSTVSPNPSCSGTFGGYFVFASADTGGSADKIYASLNGTTWFEVLSSVETTTTGKFIIYDNKLYFISTQMAYTTDLINWTLSPLFYNYGVTANGIAFDSDGNLNAVSSNSIKKQPLITTTTNLTLSIMEQAI